MGSFVEKLCRKLSRKKKKALVLLDVMKFCALFSN